MNLQEFIDQARSQVISSGSLMPTLYVQLEQEHHMLMLDTFEETQGVVLQQSALARQGWDLAKKHQGQRLVVAYFFALAWRSKGSTMEFTIQPRRDPQRQEIITIQSWTAETNTIQTYRLAIQRDKHIQVGEPEPTTTMQFTFMSAFVEGYNHGQRPDEEVFAEMEQNIDARLAALSPEQRQDLLRLLKDSLG